MTDRQPKERPILFSAPMVRAILEGRKTQTRRLMKMRVCGGRLIPCPADDDAEWAAKVCEKPFGQVGDRLWVREAFQDLGRWERRAIGETGDAENVWHGGHGHWYTADGEQPPEHSTDTLHWRKMPSIHLPRRLSRIMLQITNIRAERLQDISEADAIAEGMRTVDRQGKDTPGFEYHGEHWLSNMDGSPAVCWTTAKDSFGQLWRLINGEKSWESNPWVWVVDFNVMSKRATT